MSSILTNNGAMVALQSLQSINKNLADTQNLISTGKSVSSAKDNAAVWAISKVMEADVKGFKGIADSLALGESTVAVARQASETVTDLLTQIKGKIVAAQEENVDRAKIQTDVTALRDQISAVVGAAQFNGLNLLSNTSTTAGSGNVEILSSLDRSGSGVAVSNITVNKQDLGQQEQVIGTTAVGTLANFITGTPGAVTGASTAAARTITFETGVTAGTGYRVTLSTAVGTATLGTGGGDFTPTAGVYEYVARDGDTSADVARALSTLINGGDANAVSSSVGATDANGDTGLTLNFDATTDGVTFAIAAFTSAGATVGGGLSRLSQLDVTTDTAADTALAEIESLIQTSVDSAAAFGSVEGRIETQSKFIGGLMDSLKSGIGTLVDANMEEASARLQALQVQQQLGVQSLSIANQAPQSILSLFR
ncbi:flagellin [Wenxinia saemankumensis]|uniref:Flagellin n=1 Tax=Wenxinia saemankumensis TaxID=1447782 RepID=A0A1M6G5I8_9RHOB|nr:flagellin [Wenxinia saemankumensis]SHJ05212.1 flagellin [Wenxinia saemankumensis]